MRLCLLPLLCGLALPLQGAEPPAAALRKVPPPGVAVPEVVRLELTQGAALLAQKITALQSSLARDPKMLALLPDVQIFHKAVDWALRYDEFFDAKQFDAARRQLSLGHERAEALRAGKAPWTEQTGLVVRGYRSAIDGSVQPYGVIVPDDWQPVDKAVRRLDFWCHGRNEKLSELSFLEDRMKSKGEFSPAGVFVVHLYGRYCCANKFAGERDLFEALESVSRRYPIDPARVCVLGFSMGGASVWQFATHHPSVFAAASPGAGFSETAEFNKVFAPGKTPPPWWEQVLYRWYDCTPYAANLAGCPTIAYSGETDGQKQSADIMEKAMAAEGLQLERVIGPQTGHKYHPESKPKIEAFVGAAAATGRPAFPRKVRFTTYSLIYPKMEWLTVAGLDGAWERADVEASIEGDRLIITTKNVNELLLSGPFGPEANQVRTASINGQNVPVQGLKAGTRFFRAQETWQSGPDPSAATALRKTEATCGPIDHAFMSSFVFVKPTGQPLNAKLGRWTQGELEHATGFWRQVFRGDAPIREDRALSPADVANSNLVLWGDPASNAVLARILPQLPLKWTAQTIEFNGVKYDATHHAPVFIFPNPLNRKRYVVINSSVTFREEALLNNAQQIPKLPDWAIIDLNTPPDGKTPGLVVDAGFLMGSGSSSKQRAGVSGKARMFSADGAESLRSLHGA